MKNFKVNNYFFLAIVLIGFVLRLYEIDNYGLWFDEECSVLAANGISDFIDTTSINFTNSMVKSQNTINNVIRSTIIYDSGNSIAYNLMLHFWVQLFGNSDFAVRSLSLIFGCLIVCISYLISKKLFRDVLIAQVIVILICFHPLLIEYSRMARAYSMATFLSMLSTFFFIRIITIKTRNSNYLYYILFVILSLLTHYLTSTIFIAHGLIFLFNVRDKITWIKYTTSVFIVFILFYVWLYFWGNAGLNIMNERSLNYTSAALNYKQGDNPLYIPASLTNLITCIIQVWLQVFGNSMQNLGFRIRELAILLILPISLIAFMFKNGSENPYLKICKLFLITVAVQMVYSLILAVKSKHCVSFQPHYAIFVAPYATILLGFSISYLYLKNVIKRLILFLCFFLVFVIQILSLAPIYNNASSRFPLTNKPLIIASQINNFYKEGEVVVFKNANTAKLVNLYLINKKLIVERIDTTITNDFKLEKLINN